LALASDEARRALPGDVVGAMTTLRGAIRLSAHLLARDPAQLGAHLLGRIEPGSDPLLGRVLQGARANDGSPSLLPHRPTLAAPGGDLLATLTGHGGTVRALAITPDGQHGVSGSADGTLRLWDLDRQTERFVI